MNKADIEAIRNNFVLLVRELPFMDVLVYLHQDGIFSEAGVVELLDEHTNQRNFALFFNLQRRGPRAFSSFINALKHSKRQDLVNALISFELRFANLTI